MNKIPIILTTLAIASIFVSSSIPDSEAKLWDFVVDIEFLKSPINEGKNPILIGTVVDHAYRPLSNIDVKLTVAGKSHMLKTDGNGEFGKQIDVSELKPRTTLYLFLLLMKMERRVWHVQPWTYPVTQKNLQNMKDNLNLWNWQMTYPNFVKIQVIQYL